MTSDAATAETNWYTWHAEYDDLASRLGRRLGAVQELITGFLDTAPAGELRVISLAAGQARELIPLLISHPRGRDVRARLVELDERNADLAEGAVLSAQLSGVQIVVADAGSTDSFAGAVPADLVLACGLFEMLPDDDVAAAIAQLRQLCAPGATVVWADDIDSAVLTGLFSDAGFAATAGERGTGTARLVQAPEPLAPGGVLFRTS